MNSTAGRPSSRLHRWWQRARRVGAERIAPSRVLVRHGPRDRSRVALTFDDGPDAMTREYLDVLDRLGVHATFFVVGEKCAEHGDLLVDMVRRGHELGHHGFRHLRLPRLSLREIRDELRRTAEVLPPSRTRRPLVRPPTGESSVRSLLACALLGYRTVLWSCDSDDYRTRDAGEIARRLGPSIVEPGDILLLHEGQQWTLDALPQIIARLLEAGFAIGTVGELLEGVPT